MACLGSVLYDPGTAATASTNTTLVAMTALDTTNARITFTAPANGKVLVRIRVPQKGAATNPTVLLGVMDGATVKGRQSGAAGRQTGSAGLVQHEAVFLVTGLTPSSSYTYDAAYGTEFLVASTQLGWGGPNDTSASNAYGALTYEIWETTGLLGGVMYDPGTAASASAATASVMAVLDTTNLRITFTAPASGRVLVRLRGVVNGAASNAVVHLGVINSGGSLIGRQAAMGGNTNLGTAAATDHYVLESLFCVSGLTPSSSYTWDAAWGTETVGTSAALRWGGPNDTTQDNAYGGFAYEIWTA